MRVLVDENIPRMTVERLRELGHDVRDVRGTLEQGSADSGIWSLVTNEKRLLITTDKGFTEYRGAVHCGILIVRLRQRNRLKIHESIMHAVERFDESQWPGLLVVTRDTTISTSRAGGPIEKQG